MKIDKLRLRALKLPQPNPTNEQRKTDADIIKPAKKRSKQEQLQAERDAVLYQRLKDFYGFD